MLKYSVKSDKTNPSKLTLIANEGAKEWRIVESNYKMILDWLKSNLEFKESSIEQYKNRMDAVTIHNTRVTALQSLLEEARVSTSSKSEYYFTILDGDLSNYQMK